MLEIKFDRPFAVLDILEEWRLRLLEEEMIWALLVSDSV